MCGIIGYCGSQCALPILKRGLSSLEYRGYDSSGISVQDGDGIHTVKSRGRLGALFEKTDTVKGLKAATCGIGHTRWATHGAPTDQNAHPHTTPRLSLVHNGIIENYAELASLLTARGYTFSSETDTEVAACLIDSLLGEESTPEGAIFRAVAMMRGSFAFAILLRDHPHRIYAVRRGSPLLAARSAAGCVIASDLPAILPHSKEYWRLEEGILAKIGPDGIRFENSEGEEQTPSPRLAEFDSEEAEKGGFPHFMKKEIFEAGEALQRTLSPRIKDGLPYFDIPMAKDGRLSRCSAIRIVGCGTAMHAGLLGQYAMEKYARIPVTVEVASEFRYRDPILARDELVILLSQSGETADTLAALRHARAAGVSTLAVVNVMGSSIAEEADAVLYTMAGPEIAVASTKAYSVQCGLLYLLALHLALLRGRMAEPRVRELCGALLREVPRAIAEMLQNEEHVRAFSKKVAQTDHLFYIGRGVDSALCREGSLKLKEISYIHSEAYPAGELKHGTISLIVQGTPVVAVMTDAALAEKTLSGVREVTARGAQVFLIVSPTVAALSAMPRDNVLVLPPLGEELMPFAAITALQLFAYHVAAEKGLDVDKPRNLAKSVTVE